MRLPDESTVYISAWIGQRCVACGSEFRFLRRFIVQRRDTEYGATLATVEAAYRQEASQFSDPCPCPHCGLLQPDMIGSLRSSRHFTATLFGFLILLGCSIATGIGLMPMLPGSLVCGGIVLGVLVSHLILALRDPNHDLNTNLAEANRRIEEGSLRLVKAGEQVVLPPAGKPFNRLIRATACLLGAASAFALPAIQPMPTWIGQIPGFVLYLFGGSQFANMAFAMIKLALPHQVLEMHSLVVTDESVPEGFEKK